MRLAVTAAFILTACGGSSGGTAAATTCSITLSGGNTGTYGCSRFQAGYATSNNFSSITSGVAGLTGANLSINVPGPLHPGTFGSSDHSAKATMGIQGSGKAWSLEINDDPSADRGSFTLHLETVTPTQVTATGSGYTLHGNLDATLKATDSSPDTTLHWDF